MLLQHSNAYFSVSRVAIALAVTIAVVVIAVGIAGATAAAAVAVAAVVAAIVETVSHLPDTDDANHILGLIDARISTEQDIHSLSCVLEERKLKI